MKKTIGKGPQEPVEISQRQQDSGGANPAESGQPSKVGGPAGDGVTRTVSTVGHVKQKSISQADVDASSPSGKSDIDPGGSKA